MLIQAKRVWHTTFVSWFSAEKTYSTRCLAGLPRGTACALSICMDRQALAYEALQVAKENVVKMAAFVAAETTPEALAELRAYLIAYKNAKQVFDLIATEGA